MEVDFAFLADKAEAVNGKLYLVGGAIDTVWSPGVPVIYPQFSFVMRLLIIPAELGREHRLEINLTDEDGKRLATIGGPLKTEPSANLPKGWKQGFLAVFNFVNLKFERFGNYQFEVVVNNSSLKTVPLRIAQQVAMGG